MRVAVKTIEGERNLRLIDERANTQIPLFLSVVFHCSQVSPDTHVVISAKYLTKVTDYSRDVKTSSNIHRRGTYKNTIINILPLNYRVPANSHPCFHPVRQVFSHIADFLMYL